MESTSHATVDPEVVDALPLASVAFPILRPVEQRLLMDHGKLIPLGEGKRFLDRRGVHPELRRGMGEPDQRRRLRHAVDIFEDQLARWVSGNRQHPRFAWLVPAGGDLEARLDRVYQALLRSNDYGTFVGLHALLRLPEAPAWTPYLSATSLRLARSLTPGTIHRLERALARGAAALGLPAESRPWNSDHPLLNALPTSWLYPFQPSGELGALIERGYHAGLFNVGHLAILDPSLRKMCTPDRVRSVLVAVATRQQMEG